MVRNSRNLWLSACAHPLRLLILFGTLASLNASAASVDSVSSEILEHSGEEAYWQSTVQCTGSTTRVVIRQALKQELWCTKDQAIPCSSSKIKMAEQACASISAVIPARSTTPAPSTSPSNQATRPSEPNQQRESQIRQQAAERRRAEEIAAQNKKRNLANSLAAEQQLVEQEIAQLEKLKLDLRQAELELDAEERSIIEQLRSLDNTP